MRRVYAVEVYRHPVTKAEAEEDYAELQSLIRAAKLVQVGGEVYQLRDLNGHTYIGTGKLDNLFPVLIKNQVDLIVIDAFIKPYQLKNIEDHFNIEVADRTRLILEIFKQRANSKEGKLQVQLAEAEYEIGRQVGGRGVELSGLGKGVRGPGEHIAEKQRRAYRRKIKQLKDKLEEVKRTREAHAKRRRTEARPLISLVGYTNAGKSTLLNALMKSDEIVARDQLFTTVDPTTRKIFLSQTESGPRFAYVTDTVGFIRKLPHELVEGFESTLDLVAESELALVVVDVSDPRWREKRDNVLETLDSIGSKAPLLYVYNKIDQLPPGTDAPPDGIAIAAAAGQGVDRLKHEIERRVYDSD
jgi:GTP-binding protein HflX